MDQQRENALLMEDIQMWIGELYLGNKSLQKELMRLRAELEQIKKGLSEDSPEKGRETRETTKNNG